MLKKYAAVIMIFVFVLSLAGFACGKKKKSPQKKPQTTSQKKTVIGVSLADTKDETGKLIQQSMQQSAKNEKDIQLKFSDAGKDSTKQEEEIDKLIQQKPKVIILQVVDPETGKDMVRRIMQKNIKVIAIDKLPKNAVLDGYIAPDYERAGELAGDFTAKQMVGKPAAVLLLQGDTKDTQTQNVTAGVTKSLGGLPVQTTPIPRSDAQIAATQIQQKLTAGGIGAIIATNDQLATAAADAVKTQNKSGKLTVVGVGGGQKAAQAIKSGDLTAEVDTQPTLIGQTAFKAASDMAKTQRWDYERNIRSDSSDIPAKMIPVRLITKENVFLLENAGVQGAGGGGGGGGKSGGSSSGGSSGGSKDKSSGSSGGSGGSSGGGSGSSGGGGKGGGKIMVITKAGRTVEFNVPGKVQRVRVIDVAGQGGSQKLLITTQDGKNLDYLIPDGIMEIESQEAQSGGGGQGGGQSGGQSGGGGGSGGGGSGGGGQ